MGSTKPDRLLQNYAESGVLKVGGEGFLSRIVTEDGK
jgi:hypothetical protein